MCKCFCEKFFTRFYEGSDTKLIGERSRGSKYSCLFAKHCCDPRFKGIHRWVISVDIITNWGSRHCRSHFITGTSNCVRAQINHVEILSRPSSVMMMYMAEITRDPPIMTRSVKDSWPNQTPKSAANIYSIVRIIPVLVADIND